MSLPVCGDAAGEDGQCAAYEVHRSIGMTARPPSIHLIHATMKSHDVLCGSFTAGQSGHIVSDGGEPVDAGTTLTGVLVSQIPCDPCRFFISVATGVRMRKRAY